MAALINHAFLAHAMLTTDEAVSAIKPGGNKNNQVAVLAATLRSQAMQHGSTAMRLIGPARRQSRFVLALPQKVKPDCRFRAQGLGPGHHWKLL